VRHDRAERVEDTLLAEAGEYAQLVEQLRGGKAEHNASSLADVLGPDSSEQVRFLRTLGVLEQIGSSYKVPMLYRGGLGITQGKAFVGENDAEDTAMQNWYYFCKS
jgi:hypothetical protein